MKGEVRREGEEAGGGSAWVEVGNSEIHQRGLFAKRDIPEGVLFIDYRGDKITKFEAARRASLQEHRGGAGGRGVIYIFDLNSRYDLDGDVPGNDAKYINHSCEPNAVAEIKDHGIWIRALHDIREGEEITVDYGFDATRYEEYPCWCGAKSCLGYVVGRNYRGELKKLLRTRRDDGKGRRG